jgi:HK97 family phage portal protein
MSMYADRVRMGERISTGWRRFVASVRNAAYSISDPGLAAIFNVGPRNYAGVEVNEVSAMGLSAVYRAVALVAGTIGTLPLRTLREDPDTGMLTRQPSFLDTAPGGPDGPTSMNWKETCVAQMLLHGDAFLRHIYGGAGQLIGLEPIHPLCDTVEWPKAGDDIWPYGGKWYRVSLIDGTQLRLDKRDMTQVMGLSLDGIRGISVIMAARNGLGTAIAGDRAAAKMFNNGALISGMVTSEDDMDESEAKLVKSHLEQSVNGWENAGTIPVVNRKLKFTPWQMNAKDAQFLESRAFSIEEIARWFGVPPHLLMQTDKQTSWGTGVEEQNLGLARFNLNGWTTRLEQALSRLLPNTRWVEFDFAGLERPTPEDEINLIIAQVNAGLITPNEGRALRNLPPVPGGDVLRGAQPAALPAAPESEPAPDPEPEPAAVPA